MCVCVCVCVGRIDEEVTHNSHNLINLSNIYGL